MFRPSMSEGLLFPSSITLAATVGFGDLPGKFGLRPTVRKTAVDFRWEVDR